MPIARSFGSLLLVALLCGCATVRVNQDFDASADFAAYRTYAWFPGPQAETGHYLLDNPLIHARIRAAVDRELAAKGYRKVADGSPDLFVGTHVSFDRKLDVYTVNNYYGYGRYRRWGSVGWSETRVQEYEEGTLIVDIAAAQARKLVWRGWGTRRLRRDPTPEKTTETIDRAVAEILAGFPPQ